MKMSPRFLCSDKFPSKFYLCKKPFELDSNLLVINVFIAWSVSPISYLDTSKKTACFKICQLPKTYSAKASRVFPCQFSKHIENLSAGKIQLT